MPNRLIYYTNSPVIHILEAVATPLGPDPTGQVESGIIRLVGPLITVSLRKDPLEPGKYGGTIDYKWQESIIVRKDIAEDRPEHLHCLPILKLRPLQDTIFKCLLLQPSGTAKGTFKRWGTMGDLNFEMGGLPIENGAPLWGRIWNEEWLEFEEDHGDGSYTITII
jgi:hypothetical protein